MNKKRNDMILGEEGLQTAAALEFNITSSQSINQANDVLHGLRVQQIALEQRNQELQKCINVLEISRTYYAELYDFSPVGYLSLTAEGLITEVNLTGAKLLGVERAEILRQHFDRYIVDTDQCYWYQLCLQAISHSNKQVCELRLLRADSITFFAQIDFLYQQAENGKLSLRIAFTDISDRKQAEEKLRIAAVAFETQDSIMVTDAQRDILSVNQSFSRITGYTAEEAIGCAPFFLRSDSRHGEDFYQSLWDSVKKEGFWQGETWNKRKNGEEFPAWQTITAVSDATGCVTHHVGYLTDITVQKQAEKILLDARQRLENQVITSQEELKGVRQEVTEINTVLNVLIRNFAGTATEAKIALASEIESNIIPFLNKLRGESVGRRQSNRLLNILEGNIKQLIQNYGRSASLPAAYQQLTPVEAQVASMVRQGMPTKVIAETLHSSTGTISTHRKNIRKKLGLDHKSSNLYHYLLSLSE